MSVQRSVLVTGATGLIGKALCRRLIARGDRVVVFTRNPATARTIMPGAAQYVAWDAKPGNWEAALEWYCMAPTSTCWGCERWASTAQYP